MSQYLKILLSDTQGQFIFSVNTDGNAQAGTYATSVEYSFDNDTWSTLQLNSGNNTIQLRWGGGSTELHLRNDSGVWSSPGSYAYWYITISCTVDYEIMEGSLSALLDYNDDSVVPPAGAFARLFKNDTHLTSFMPEFVTETLSNNLCEEMFYGCTNLTSASLEFTGYPTTIPYSCFLDTFHGCTSLSDGNISVLAMADTFGDRSCEGMFTGCTSLNDFASFPMQASTLGSSCFEEMYYGCTNANGPYNLTLPATTLAQSCYKGMFRNCTSLDKEVILPATSVLAYSYQQMFSGCTSLSEVVTYADTINTTYPGTANWLQNVAATGTVYNMGNATYTVDSASGIPVGWSEVQLQSSYTVTATAGQNGSISPSGAVTVNTFDSQSFTFTPAAGYEVDTVTVDGSTVSNPGFSYFFSNVTADHTISVTFKELSDYFYIERTSGSGYWTITITQTQESTPTGTYATSIEYSTDGLRWIRRTLYSGTNYISSETNKVYFRNDSGNWSTTGLYNKFNVNNNVPHITGGNPNSLLDYTDMDNVSLSESCFYYLFLDNTTLTSAANLSLPSTTLESNCYSGMFAGCRNLTSAPSLPATTLASKCYMDMFAGCSALSAAPTLPATTLAGSCYAGMFSGCSALSAAPSLPATRLVGYCYSGMFDGCRALSAAPSLPATTLVNDCYARMFRDCTSLISAPTLPATTLVNNCYANMFSGCTSLNSVTTYANNISAYCCLNNWLQNVAATGTLYNNGSATYTPNSASGIPTGWTEVGPTPSTYTITATAGSNGSISPSGSVSVNVGASQTFTVTPDTGYIVDTLTVDGSTATLTNNTYTFSNVQADHTISVTFKLPPAVIRYTSTNQASGNWVTNNTDTTRNTYDSTTHEGVLYLNNGVTTIGGGTSKDYSPFNQDSGLTAVDLDDAGLTNIGMQAFTSCTGLTSINIPSGVTTIGSYAFSYCSGLTSLTIGSGVTTIGDSAFQSCSGLTSITIPNNVTTIGNSAFQICSGLTSLTIGSGVTSIGYSAFYGCPALASITVDSNNTYYNDGNGSNCLIQTSNNELIKGSNNSVIPSGVTTIGNSAFTSCTGLTSINIPSGVTTIGNGAFISCTGLTSLTIGSGVTTIGDSAFNGCTNLVSVIGLENTSITQLNSGTFQNCSSLTTISLPSTLTSMSYEVFDGCTNLVSVIGLENTSITQLEGNQFRKGTFQNCSSLTTISLPSTLTTISGYYSYFNSNGAFMGCSSLTSITIPSSVTSINNSAFKSCSALTSVTCEATTPPTLGTNNFTASNDTLYVPVGCVPAYQADSAWNSAFTTITEVPHYTIVASVDGASTGSGSISPSGSSIFYGGETQTYTISADSGSYISDVVVDGNSVGAVSSYTFTNIAADHTIEVTFELVSHTITATAHENANISPSGPVSVLEGDDQSFSVYPDAGYEISDVEVDGSSVGAVTEYTFYNVTSDHTIDVYAIPIPPAEHQIMAFGYDHASINPSGTITVTEGNDQTFTMAADAGYQISDVLVDGSSVGAVSSYTFTDVQDSHEIAVYGEPIPVPTYNCSVTVATTGGSVMPLSATVDEGQDITFTVTTEEGYTVDNLIDNGTDVTSRMVGNTYTISDVSADHTLSISFVRVVIQYSIVSTAGEGGSISPLGRTYVDEGSSQTYTITPDEGNEIDRLIVDGHEVTPAATYTFENVVSDHTIEATFKETPPPPPPVPDYGLNLSEMIDTDYVAQYGTK